MALAYLCSRAHRLYMSMRVADNPVSLYHCVIIDHRIREGSDLEARAVATVLKERLRLKARVLAVGWGDVLKAAGCAHPKELPNFETVARRLRYRYMAEYCAQGHMASVFLAHHEDDQYETLLMRMLSGHGASGLLGMRAATDIPECHDVHGAYQSGFLDDQASPHPMINYRPTRDDMRRIRTQMTQGMDFELVKRELREGAPPGAFSEEELGSYFPRTKWILPAAPPRVEDGGIMIYRPLLAFSKDRLVATCEANGIPWFEDATNADATLTMRNAVRHLCKNHTLPVALQKPAVLAMSRRLNRRADLDAAEADRLLRRTVVKDFESISGTAIVQLPSFRIPRYHRSRNPEAVRTKRLEHYRDIAALLLKRIIAIATPQPPGSITSNLLNAVLQLCPSLDECPKKSPQPPKAFNLAGVHFTPIWPSSKTSGMPQWHISREPYVSDRPRPHCNFSHLPLAKRQRRRPEYWRWPSRWLWKLWDGRFWVGLQNRSPLHAAFAPFDVQHAKAFRDSLPDGRSRDKLMTLLKLYAPGKVRYTLPAIYTAGNINVAIRDYERLAAQEKTELLEEFDAERQREKASHGGEDRGNGMGMGIGAENKEDKPVHEITGSRATDDKRVLVALPTLGIARPGLQKWIRYDVRYKRVDRRILDGTVKDETELAVWERLRRTARRRGARAWFERCALRRKHQRRVLYEIRGQEARGRSNRSSK